MTLLYCVLIHRHGEREHSRYALPEDAACVRDWLRGIGQRARVVAMRAECL